MIRNTGICAGTGVLGLEKCRWSTIHFVVRAGFVLLGNVCVARLGPGNQIFLSRVHKDKARDFLG